MDCEEIQKHLSAYMDGELSEETVAEVREHLAGCPECQKVLAELKATVNLIQELPKVSAPEGLAEAVGREIRRRVPAGLPRQEKVVRPRVVRRFAWPQFAAAAAAAILVIGVGIFVLYEPEPPVGPTPAPEAGPVEVAHMARGIDSKSVEAPAGGYADYKKRASPEPALEKGAADELASVLFNYANDARRTKDIKAAANEENLRAAANQLVLVSEEPEGPANGELIDILGENDLEPVAGQWVAMGWDEEGRAGKAAAPRGNFYQARSDGETVYVVVMDEGQFQQFNRDLADNPRLVVAEESSPVFQQVRTRQMANFAGARMPKTGELARATRDATALGTTADGRFSGTEAEKNGKKEGDREKVEAFAETLALKPREEPATKADEVAPAEEAEEPRDALAKSGPKDDVTFDKGLDAAKPTADLKKGLSETEGVAGDAAGTQPSAALANGITEVQGKVEKLETKRAADISEKGPAEPSGEAEGAAKQVARLEMPDRPEPEGYLGAQQQVRAGQAMDQQAGGRERGRQILVVVRLRSGVADADILTAPAKKDLGEVEKAKEEAE